MILNCIVSYNKQIAWILFFVAYADLVSPVFANTYRAPFYQGRFATVNDKAKKPLTVFNDAKLPFVNDDNNVIRSGNLSLKSISGKVRDKVKNILGPGPTQPEMQSFQSVSNANMVDLFTGDFSYNIPLLDVGGYPINIHYNSGITMDQEASWVGLGWNINPGTINRNMRGLPDDFNGTDKITKTLSMQDNKTVGVTLGANVELFGKTKTSEQTGKSKPGTLSGSVGVFHNTYNGWGTEFGINAGINSGKGSKGNLSGGIGLTNNSQSGLDVSPSFSYQIGKQDSRTKGDVGIGTNFNSRIGLQAVQMTMQIRQQANDSKGQPRLSFNSTDMVNISFAAPSYTPSISIPFTSSQATYTVKIGGVAWALHPNFFVSGNFSKQYIAEEDRTDSLPAYGYLYYQESDGQKKVLLDFNREKDVAFRKTTPNVGIPSYTYDIYSITGEGIGGMFRPYRGDVGMIYDHTMATKSNSKRISVDLGFGHSFHGGVDLNAVWAGTQNNPWLNDNVMARYLGFKKSDSLYESVYFKNPGEKTTVDQAFFNKIGDDNLVRVQLSPGQNQPVISATKNFTVFKNARPFQTLALANNTYRTQRDKRTQVISYLTGEETARKSIGLDTVIKSYYINTFPSTRCNTNYKIISRVDSIRKPHHISEISVLNTDGKRYVYGLPAYNLLQKDVSFSVDKTDGDLSTGLVSYTAGVDNSFQNSKGKEHYYSAELIPAYATSFLLTGILSSDYVDITGDGITEDDNGTAVKFNYSQVYGGSNPYLWRMPVDASKAMYNEGLKTYSRDDRGSYSFGKKELWYLNSVESKSMIATFVLETDTLRKDSYGVTDENGGRSNAKNQYRLKQINLYTKADFLKNGVDAKPIKSVHFEYTYELCAGVPSSNSVGKLTLRKIWFSYNKNYKGQKNPYIFNYSSNNPDYNSQSADRWGNYKKPADNPASAGTSLTNAEYPYSLQKTNYNWDSSKAALNAESWSLKEIKLPSGGLMKVTYESDDYAYVQNKRAMNMFSIAGLASDSTGALSASLYSPNKSGSDYLYVFVKLTDAVKNKKDLAERYFDGVSKLYFKLLVKMPDNKDAGKWGTGYEQIPCFAEIEDYNIRSGTSNKTIWIKLKQLNSNSPLATTAIQYLRLNLPSKAYPYSEPGDKASFKDVVGMLASIGPNLVNSVSGFGDAARGRNWCNLIDTAKSYVRLDNPYYKKFGGGHRVKKIEVYDNWLTMTSQTESTYGQTYNYTTNQVVNSDTITISSGVASYEPVLGKEENPFYQPIEYAEKMAALGPTDFVYTEEPLGESFFPGAGVGYSKVTVQTINKTKKSANGTDVTEFFTAKDFPTIVENTALDGDSKKTYANPIGNALKFNAQRYITLSQGFKIELNDMHGKIKTQSSFAQTDLFHPISYTSNYYKLDNDNAGVKHLSNSVTTADSSTGTLNVNGQIGKDIDLLIDIREQTSKTVSASLQLNGDFAAPFFFMPSKPNLPSFEVNRYRSIAVTKVINRYGILDSVVHFDKGSKISTANAVYDGETGDVILSRTQNEFDDQIYSFNYPAYWAYSGMEGAYENIGARFQNVTFLNGKMNRNNNGQNENDIKKYFESGDELLFYGRLKKSKGNRLCQEEDFNDASFYNTVTKIWAVDLAKSGLGSTGIFFIDKDGVPITGRASMIKIIRSGKRNLQSRSVGSIISLKSPIKVINGVTKLVLDSTIDVINANIVKYKDLWKVDSSSYRKDTTVTSLTYMGPGCNSDETITINAAETYAVYNKRKAGWFKSRKWYGWNDNPYFEAFANTNGCQNHSDENMKTWLRFDLSTIPQNAIISSATLELNGTDKDHPQFFNRNQTTNGSGVLSSNASKIYRTKKTWIGHYLSTVSPWIQEILMKRYYDYTVNGPGEIDTAGQISIPPSIKNVNEYKGGSYDATVMVRNMLSNYYNSGRKNLPAMTMDMPWPGECSSTGGSWMKFGFLGGTCGTNTKTGSYYKNAITNDCKPKLKICLIKPCTNGSIPVYLTSPVAGYYCTQPKDTFVCKPNINDTSTNPYRWGMWGNWQVDKAYSYYNFRKDSLASSSSVTNIRTDGVINAFKPYWTFTTSSLSATEDVNRWVWTTQTDLINSKGLELQNHDQLLRYNSVLYGYNQTLPVAVAQNSRSREMVFDGFEDYTYTTDTCTSCPKQRFLNLVSGGTIIDSLSHSGIYSLLVAGNQADSTVVPIAVNDSAFESVRAKSSTFFLSNDTTVKENGGFGLTVLNTNLPANGACSYWVVGDNMNYNLNQSSPSGSCTTRNFYQTEWRGYIQPRYSEWYTFYCTAPGNTTVIVNNQRISANRDVESGPSDGSPLIPIKLYAGQFYYISVKLIQPYSSAATVKLEWQSSRQVREIVPKGQLFTSYVANPSNLSITSSRPCTNFDTLRQVNMTVPGFSPVKSTKIVVGAWVREKNSLPDTVSSYRNTQIQIVFNNGSSVSLKPSGAIIEGWQRIEDTLTIPVNATQMKLKFTSTNSSIPSYFDDIRIHPFNANLKSYVYDPVNLRLVAELDESNYTSFYEYDDDGTLTRIKKETEKGIKTIKETRSALLK